jgi:hypothetical protein
MNILLNGNKFYEVTAGYHSIDSAHSVPHTGVDLAMKCGDHLNSPANGVVENIVDYGSQNIGKGIIIKTDDGEHLILGHLSDNSRVRIGDSVHVGDYIADTGSTGRSTGCHLHVGLRDNHGFINPVKYFNGSGGTPHYASTVNDVVHATSPGELLYNAISSYADSLGSLGMNLVSSINWDGLFDTLDFIFSIFIL